MNSLWHYLWAILEPYIVPLMLKEVLHFGEIVLKWLCKHFNRYF